MSIQTVDIDVVDYESACKKSQLIYEELTMKLNNISYIKNKITIHPLKFYHFKITRNDNSDGVYICLHPNELNNGIQVYDIVNQVKNFNSCTYCKNTSDIINYMNNNLFKNETIRLRINYISIQLKKIKPDFKIAVSDDTILMYDNRTQNGYIIILNIDYYAKIGIVNNMKWYPKHKTTCITHNPTEFFAKINNYLSINLHENPIKMIKMRLSKDIPSDDESELYDEIRELHSKHRYNYDYDPS